MRTNNGMGDIFDFIDAGGSVADWYDAAWSMPPITVPDFVVPTFEVPNMNDFYIDTSSWAVDTSTGNIVDLSQNLIVNTATIDEAINSGVMPDVSQLPTVDFAAANAAASTFVQAGPGGWYDTETGITYAPDGSVIGPDGTFIEKGSSFVASSPSVISQLVKAGWSALSQYRTAALPGGGTLLVPRNQVLANGQIASGQYAGVPTSAINTGSFSQQLSNMFSGNMLIPVGLGLLAVFALSKGQS